MRWTQPLMEPTPNIPSSRYKGIVSQPNSQIYENNHRVRLGTFDTEEAAARSYDRAATKFRGHDAILNFNPNKDDNQDEDNIEEKTIEERDYINEVDKDVNHDDDQEEEEKGGREKMFEKTLTPSDVGKLNRLVIPKQHAEKYLTLCGGGGDSAEKRLLLSFEDESGKAWRFCYSYRNSSQSYVLTKGWNGYVKEKRLNAGDVVSFECRRRFDGDRFYIRWRRRAASVQDSGASHQEAAATMGPCTRFFYSGLPYPSHLHGPPLPHQSNCLHAGTLTTGSDVQNPATPGKSKRLRLFGVNLECQPEGSESPMPDGSSSSRVCRVSHHLFSQASGLKESNHKDSNFLREINQRGDRGGYLPM